MAQRLNLVTGATGFSASHLIMRLLADGQKVVATDLPAALANGARRRTLEALGLDYDHPNLELAPANLLDGPTLDPLFERPITHVFHTASLYDYSASLEKLRRINVEGTRNLVERAKHANLERFVHWSTCGVFGKPYTAADGPKHNVPFDETCPSPKNQPYGAREPAGTHLVNAYSVSKWEQEQMMWRYHREDGLPLTVIRPAPIYGPGSDYGHGGIILAIARGYVPAIPADAKNYITTSVHVHDLARFAQLVGDADQALGEDYNVVDDSIISYHEFLHYIALLCGRRLIDVPLVTQKMLRPAAVGVAHAWTFLERRFGVPRVKVFEVQSATYMASSYWLSNRKTRTMGFEYDYPDVKEGLKDTVAWFTRQGWIWR